MLYWYSFLFQSINLGKPWGVCGELTLKHFSDYDDQKCARDCEIETTWQECQCLAPYMPIDNGKELCNWLSGKCIRIPGRYIL